MKIVDFLNPRAISINLKATDKKGVISELAELLVKVREVKDKDGMVKALLDREALGSTGIGQGIAIPHAKLDSVRELVAAFGLSRKGISFDALDGEPVHIFFLLVAPINSAGPHLKALARICRLLKDRFFRQLLMDARDEKEILRIIREEDQKIH